jgi:hypothetical protein
MCQWKPCRVHYPELQTPFVRCVKATVINCEPSAAVLGINFDETEMARCLSMAARFELAAVRGERFTYLRSSAIGQQIQQWL